MGKSSSASRVAKMRAKRKAAGKCIDCERKIKKYVRCGECRVMVAYRVYELRQKRAELAAEQEAQERERKRNLEAADYRLSQKYINYCHDEAGRRGDVQNRGLALPIPSGEKVYDGRLRLGQEDAVLILRSEVA